MWRCRTLLQGQTTPYMPDISPEPVAHLAQHRLLPLMAQRAAADPGVTLRMGHRVSQFEQSDEGVKVTVEGPQVRTSFWPGLCAYADTKTPDTEGKHRGGQVLSM